MARFAEVERSAIPKAHADAEWVELDPLLPDPACLGGRAGRWMITATG
ncbi:hypothetical protein [Saccharothrix sp. Mg75]